MLGHLEATFVMESPPLSARAGHPMDGEDLDSQRSADAQHWLNVYRELVVLLQAQLDRATVELSQPSVGPDSRTRNATLKRILGEMQHAIERRDRWQRRYWELCGIEADAEAGSLALGGARVQVTRRELELLAFLVRNPNTTFSAGQLLARAWEEPTLSVEQVRTYISVLRRKLSAAGMPVRIETAPPPARGYRATITLPSRVGPVASEFDRGFAAGVASTAALAAATIPMEGVHRRAARSNRVGR